MGTALGLSVLLLIAGLVAVVAGPGPRHYLPRGVPPAGGPEVVMRSPEERGGDKLLVTPAKAVWEPQSPFPDPSAPSPAEETEAEKKVSQPSPKAPATGKPARFTLKRRKYRTDEDLRKQLLVVPEVDLDAVPRTSARLVGTARQLLVSGMSYPGPAMLEKERQDLAGLPLRMGADCRLGKEPAENLHVLSRKLRAHLAAAVPKEGVDSRPDPDRLREVFLENEGAKRDWLQPAAIPVLLQMLQAENTPARLILVEILSRIPGPEASAALAVRAMVDLSFPVREAAVRALKDRPADEVRGLLIAGLRYPWPAVADHAAEALTGLGDKEAVPLLVKLLNEPDPGAPFSPVDRAGADQVVHELVRVNHLGNCALCHSPSFAATDLVRGSVPVPGQPLPPSNAAPQYYDRGEIFVRADVTYLRQDFSVMQTVAQPGNWPAHQRYDYLVRTRRLSVLDPDWLALRKKGGEGYEQREAVLFALRELTGKDLGTAASTWQMLLPREQRIGTLASLADHSALGDWKRFLAAKKQGEQ